MMSIREQPWTWSARRGRASRLTGFTFAELLLVLTLLLIVSSLVIPPVVRMMADQPLKTAAERARAQIANTRLKALDSSAAWQFRFEPGGTHYLWMPQERVVPAAGQTNTGSVTNASASTPASPTIGELPKGVNFLSDINGTPLTVERLPQELVAGLPNAYQMAQIGWSSPLTFQPDGSAIDSEVAVVDARNRQIRLTVRGFTGGVTVSTIETRRR